MTGFNFSINSNESSISTSKRTQLKPFEIHTVTFNGVEIKEGVSKAGNNYKMLQFSFSNKDGVANLSLFWPNPEKDGIRPTFTNKEGHDYEGPSTWEKTRSIIIQTIETLSPEGFKKMQELSAKFKTFDDMANVFIKLVNKCIGTEVDVKFYGKINKDGYMQLSFPKLVSINKSGELYVSDNYIGFGTLGLSEYELREGKKLNNTNITKMESDPSIDIDTKNEEEDDSLDFENL